MEFAEIGDLLKVLHITNSIVVQFEEANPMIGFEIGDGLQLTVGEIKFVYSLNFLSSGHFLH